MDAHTSASPPAPILHPPRPSLAFVGLFRGSFSEESPFPRHLNVSRPEFFQNDPKLFRCHAARDVIAEKDLPDFLRSGPVVHLCLLFHSLPLSNMPPDRAAPGEKARSGFLRWDQRSFGPSRGTKLWSEKNAIERFFHSVHRKMPAAEYGPGGLPAAGKSCYY